MKASVIGSPISHSLSPAIFRFLSKDQSKDIAYTAQEVSGGEVKDFLEKCKASNEYIGFNVTLPLKEVVQSELNEISEEAIAIGAVNVIQFTSSLAKGFNTDIIGIQKTLERSSLSLSSKSCLIWGAGGSAKAVGYVLGKLGARKVIILNRSNRGEELIRNLSQKFPQTHFQFLTDINLIEDEVISLTVNTTPLGMGNNHSGLEYFKQAHFINFSKDALAFDLIYTPERTDFMKVASELGLNVVGGLGMLIDQALATWKIWIGPLSNEERLFKRLNSYLRGILRIRESSQPLFLTGFMGVGKSTVGRELARISKRELVETDRMIEESAGKSIPSIFETEGEAGFRQLEKTSIKLASASERTIVSLGGGAILDPENFSLISKSGTLVYLEADAETLGARIKDQKAQRPLLDGLQGNEYMEKITIMLTSRKNIYEQAHIKISTSGLDPIQVCIELLIKIGEADESQNS